MIDELREQRQTKDVPFVNDEKNNLLNIVGGVDVVERENKNGECFKVVNFSVFSKYEESNNVYKTYSVYWEKGDISKDFQQWDFVKLFGQTRTSADDNWG